MYAVHEVSAEGMQLRKTLTAKNVARFQLSASEDQHQ